MRAGLGVGVDGHRAGPQLLRADAGEIDRRGAVHARGLGGVGVERAGGDHPHAVMFPVGHASDLGPPPRLGKRGSLGCRHEQNRRNQALQAGEHRRADGFRHAHARDRQVGRHAGRAHRPRRPCAGRPRHRHRRRRQDPRPGEEVDRRSQDRGRDHAPAAPASPAATSRPRRWRACSRSRSRASARPSAGSASRRSAPRPCRAAPPPASPTRTYIFALPGSTGACKDGWDDILRQQLDIRFRPCNFAELMPRLNEGKMPQQRLSQWLTALRERPALSAHGDGDLPGDRHGARPCALCADGLLARVAYAHEGDPTAAGAAARAGRGLPPSRSRPAARRACTTSSSRARACRAAR